MLQHAKSLETTVDLELHDLEDTRTNNHEISGLLQLLERPLPVERLRDAKLLPTFPPDFREQINTLCDRYPNHEEDSQPSRFLEVRPVTDILEIVLNAVLFLRYSKPCTHGFKERRSSWISMLAACGMAMENDVAICEDGRISTPRTTSNQNTLNFRDVETEAALTLSVNLRRTPRHHARQPIIVSNDEQDSSSTSDASYDSYATLDLPFDAHITPPRGKRVDFVLPVVFAARRQEMQDIMTSLVCQRRVLGITAPVIGVVLHEEGACASLAFGWFDNAKSPTVHLAYAAASDSPASHPLPPGIFDGANPISALRLGQFILDLKSHFASIKQHLHQPQVHDFCWRLDHAHFDHSHISSPASNNVPCSDEWARVREWVATLDFADTPEPDPPFLELLDIGEAIIAAEAFAPVQRPPSLLTLDTASTMSKASKGKVSETTTQTSVSASLEVPGKPSQAGSATKSDAASAYAKRRSEDDDRGLAEWTRSHGTVLLFDVPFDNTEGSALKSQINNMHHLLESVLCPAWPEHWKTKDDLPRCDAAVREYRTTLFKSYESKDSAIFHKKCEILPKGHPICQAVEDCMTMLLTVTANAAISDTNCTEGILSEAATRSAWDQLLKLGCRAPAEAVSRSFFVEKTIRLPTDRSAIKDGSYRMSAFANYLEFITLAQLMVVTDLKGKLPPGLLELARHASDRAAKYAKAVSNNQADALLAADREIQPSRAKMDGVYCFLYDPTAGKKGSPGFDIRKLFSNDMKYFPLGSKGTPTNACRERGRNMVRSRQTNAKASTSTNESSTPEDPSSSNPSKPKVVVPNVPHAACSICPEITSSVHKMPTKKPNPSATKIFVPFIFAEYKRDAQDSYQAFNQVKLYCISGVEFLASIGVKDFPVFGIVTAGSEGVILMAWKSTILPEKSSPNDEPPEYNFLFDRNLKRFNLTEPLQAFHFFVCARRIYAFQDELKLRLDEANVGQRLADAAFEDWMMPT